MATSFVCQAGTSLLFLLFEIIAIRRVARGWLCVQVLQGLSAQSRAIYLFIFSAVTTGFSVGTVGVSLGTVGFSVAATGFSVGTGDISLEVVDVSSGVTGVSEGPVGGPRGLGGSTVDAGPAKKNNSWSLVNITPPPS